MYIKHLCIYKNMYICIYIKLTEWLNLKHRGVFILIFIFKTILEIFFLKKIKHEKTRDLWWEIKSNVCSVCVPEGQKKKRSDVRIF